MINPKFQDLINKNSKFTIILGSGFHRQAIGANSILSNWEKLLKNQDPNLIMTGFYPLDYEQLIIRKTSNKSDNNSKGNNAEQIEKRISDEISFELKCAQEKAIKFNKSSYPKGIFNPFRVSDVISLNFDTTAEGICCELLKVKKTKYNPSKFESKEQGKFEIPCWEVELTEKEKIRFWYPHGSIHVQGKLTLGTREYAMRLEKIERMRKHSKKKKNDPKEPTSWYHQFTHNPVLILGSSMEKNEWDIWFALVNRERNFAKNENIQFKHPIFQMRECECKNDAQHEWFEPLFTGMKFDEQWKELEKQFKI